MQKENREVVIEKEVILNLIQNLQRKLLSLRNGVRGRSRIKYGMTLGFTVGLAPDLYANFRSVAYRSGEFARPARPPISNKGFTLIELLVVVLIIGILAAVALPQYEKAVWKSRAANMQTFLRNVENARQAYYLANATQATELDELAVSFEGFTAGSVLGGSSSAPIKAYNDMFEIRLDNAGSSAYFISGKYKGCGFSVNKMGEWKCKEWDAYYRTAGGFCQKIMKAGELVREENNMRYYAM